MFKVTNRSMQTSGTAGAEGHAAKTNPGETTRTTAPWGRDMVGGSTVSIMVLPDMQAGDREGCSWADPHLQLGNRGQWAS